MLEWWFDIEDRICCARMNERNPAPVLTVDGGARLRFQSIKALKSGLTYLYITEKGHNISINDVKVRGERFVSLYCDGKLVKEYNVRKERLRKIFDEHSDVFMSVKGFWRKMIPFSAMSAFFFAVVAVAVMSGFGVFGTLVSACVTAAAFWGMFALFIGGVFTFVYASQRRQMEKYSLVPGEKKVKKRVRKKSLKRRMH